MDIDRTTLNIDIDEVIKAINPKTKVIFAVNLLGNPCDFERLQSLCNEKNIILFKNNIFVEK